MCVCVCVLKLSCAEAAQGNEPQTQLSHYRPNAVELVLTHSRCCSSNDTAMQVIRQYSTPHTEVMRQAEWDICFVHWLEVLPAGMQSIMARHSPLAAAHLCRMRLLSNRGGPGPAAFSNRGMAPSTVPSVAEVKIPCLKCACIHDPICWVLNCNVWHCTDSASTD